MINPKLKKSGREFQMDDRGIREGWFLKTNVGLNNAYKKPLKERLHDGIKRIPDEEIIRFTLEGYNKLKKNGVPVTERKPDKVIRGSRMIVFEKAKDIQEHELHESIPEAASVIKAAGIRGIKFDSGLHNFGINKDGKVVVRDTNRVVNAGIAALPWMAFQFWRSLLKSRKYRADTIVSIGKLIIRKG